jgi:hypothetical protein
MAQTKYDGIIQAVRYDDQGRVMWVRAFLRRGPTWSDYMILDRQTLIDQIKSGKRFAAGQRIPQLATTFEIGAPVNLSQANGQEILVTGDNQAEKDRLDGVPLI